MAGFNSGLLIDMLALCIVYDHAFGNMQSSRLNTVTKFLVTFRGDETVENSRATSTAQSVHASIVAKRWNNENGAGS